MSSLRLPKDKSEAQRVVWETLQIVKTKLGVRQRNAFSSLATEIMGKLYPTAKGGNAIRGTKAR